MLPIKLLQITTMCLIDSKRCGILDSIYSIQYFIHEISAQNGMHCNGGGTVQGDILTKQVPRCELGQCWELQNMTL